MPYGHFAEDAWLHGAAAIRAMRHAEAQEVQMVNVGVAIWHGGGIKVGPRGVVPVRPAAPPRRGAADCSDWREGRSRLETALDEDLRRPQSP